MQQVFLGLCKIDVITEATDEAARMHTSASMCLFEIACFYGPLWI